MVREHTSAGWPAGAIAVTAIPRAGAVDDRRRPAAERLVVVMRGSQRFVTRAGGEVEQLSIGRFPNGELHAEVPGRVEGRRVIVVGSISPPPGNLERLTLAAHALRRAGAARVTALLPYLAYARQDRSASTESLGLQWVGELLRASGVEEVVCVDVHSEQAAEVLGLGLTSLSPAGLLAGALPDRWRDQVTFVAPDGGALERCSAVARAAGSGRPVVWARKRRTPSGIEHLGLVGSPGPRAVIVDDVLDTGATLLSCCCALRACGVEQIGVIVTHGLFTGERWRAMFGEGVHELWMTDTVLSRRRPRQAHIVPVASLLTAVLGRGNA